MSRCGRGRGAADRGLRLPVHWGRPGHHPTLAGWWTPTVMGGGSVVRRSVRAVTRMPAQALVRRLPPAFAEIARGPLPGDSSLRGRARREFCSGCCAGAGSRRTPACLHSPTTRSCGSWPLTRWCSRSCTGTGSRAGSPNCCRHAGGVLELGANMGYFTVQGGRAAPSTRYVAVEPHPGSWRICRDNLALNGVTSVRLLAAAAAADPTVSTVSLHVSADQLATPTPLSTRRASRRFGSRTSSATRT